MTTPLPPKSGRYLVIHKMAHQKKERISVLDLLGIAHERGLYVFSARPRAGTQEIPIKEVLAMAPVSKQIPIVLNAREVPEE
jgi:hypothetical protein